MPKNKKTREEFDRLFKTFENLILTGQFRPGQRLIETELAKRLDTSRYWIRDSLKVMAEKGLVKIIPYKGAIVADLSVKEIEDIFVIRVALERLAIQLAVENFSSEDLRHLKQLADRFEAAYEQDDIQRMIQSNAEFHDFIFTKADNPKLMQLIVDMRLRLHIVRYAAWSSPEVLAQIVKEHRVILSALKNKDFDTLFEVSEKHISYSKKYYLAQLKTIAAMISGN